MVDLEEGELHVVVFVGLEGGGREDEGVAADTDLVRHGHHARGSCVGAFGEWGGVAGEVDDDDLGLDCALWLAWWCILVFVVQARALPVSVGGNG